MWFHKQRWTLTGVNVSVSVSCFIENKYNKIRGELGMQQEGAVSHHVIDAQSRKALKQIILELCK